MAERTTAKTKPSGSPKAPAKASAQASAKAAANPAANPTSGGARGAENARLKSELADALERIADLEMKQADIVNRIDRVIDSLQKLPEDL